MHTHSNSWGKSSSKHSHRTRYWLWKTPYFEWSTKWIEPRTRYQLPPLLSYHPSFSIGIWFLVPSVALVEQHFAILDCVPVPVERVTGDSGPRQRNTGIWCKFIDSHRKMVSTSQILLDVPHHGFIFVGEVGMLMFDEIHHAISDHPYNAIMRRSYFHLSYRSPHDHPDTPVRPATSSLTAQSMKATPWKVSVSMCRPRYVQQKITVSPRKLEANLDTAIRPSLRNREELERSVSQPIFKHVFYEPSVCEHIRILQSESSLNLITLRTMIRTLKLDEDPYMIPLRHRLKNLDSRNPSYRELDQGRYIQT